MDFQKENWKKDEEDEEEKKGFKISGQRSGSARERERREEKRREREERERKFVSSWALKLKARWVFSLFWTTGVALAVVTEGKRVEEEKT